jgi:hypothetical protein
MNTPILVKTTILFTIAMISIMVSASPRHNNEYNEQQKAHIHGLSEISLSISDNKIEIKFESPASNIVGFEHAAKTIKQKERVQYARSSISKPLSLFSISGTHCNVMSSVINGFGLLEGQEEHSQENNHIEISAQYQFECSSVAELKNIEIKIFESFPNISEIKVQWISETDQGMSILNPSNNKLIIGE